MADLEQFHLRVITPEGTAIEENATFVKFHAVDGEIGVEPDHSATLSKIVPGEMIIHRTNGEKAYYFIPSGLAEIMTDHVTILTPYVEEGSTLDLERAQSAEKRAVNRVKNPTGDTDVSRAKNALTRAKARLYLHELIEKASKI